MNYQANNNHSLFTPSSTDLLNMMKAAEAKFAAAANGRFLRERAERAFRINAQLIRGRREHDVRRYVNAGDRAWRNGMSLDTYRRRRTLGLRSLSILRRGCMKHTPGPWQRSGVRRKLGDEDCIQVGPDGFAIAFLPIGRRPKEQAGAIADAALIASAPDLVRELNHAAMLLALAADKVRCVDFEGDRFDLLVEAERFDALIAAALGEGA